MTGEVVFVQSMHDQHDRTRRLVVESTVKGMVTPLVGCPRLRLRQRLLGLQRSSMLKMSAPRPVNTPPW
jgi:hypothetical protein